MNPEAIRSIIESIESLTESTGLAGRKPGDKFVDPATKHTLTFDSIQFFPSQGGKFTSEELDMAVNNAENAVKKEQSTIFWENSRGPKSGGFAIATFIDDENKNVYTGRYMEKINPNPTDNFVPNEIYKGKYKFSGKAAVKAQSGLSPQDLLTKQNDLDIPQIMNQLAQALGTDSQLYYVAHHIASGKPLPLTFTAPPGISFTAFRDYFCEILQPMALQKGQFDGNAGEAADRFLAPAGFAGSRINYGGSKTEGLQDSSFTTPDGKKKLKVSSKGGKGATATVKNLYDVVTELKKIPEQQGLAKKYAKVIDMLENIVQQGMHGSPLYLGTKFKVIDDTEAALVKGLRNTKSIDLTAPGIEKKLKSMGLTPKLIDFALERKTDNPSDCNLYYHLIASIAEKASNLVNEKTNFSAAAADILNNGALIQVYTKARESKDKWTLDEFHTVYPGTLVGGVLFTPSKTYYSTDIKGNFTFKILSSDKSKSSDLTESEIDPGRARRKTYTAKI